MVENKSYKIGETTAKEDVELNRLKNQANIFWDQEKFLLNGLDIASDSTIVDIGCGPGFILENMGQAFPKCNFIGLDLDPRMIEIANSRLDDLDRVDFRQGSIFDMPLEDQNIDLVFARLVFMHLDDPIKALEEIYRVLKPNGYIVIIDVDDGVGFITDPPMPIMDKIRDGIVELQSERGGDRLLIRKIPNMLQTTNYRDPNIYAMVKHSEISNIDALIASISKNLLTKLVEKELITTEEFDKIQKFEEKYRNGNAEFMMQVLFVFAQK